MLERLRESGMWRIAVVAGLLACALTIVAALRANRTTPWQEQATGVQQVSLRSDLLYRFYLSLEDLPATEERERLAWWAQQYAIATYERLAYQPIAEAAHARVKLAIIYGKEGYRQHASDLLAQLPSSAPGLDRVAVLLDWLYGTGQPPANVEDAMADVRDQFEPWVGRTVLMRLAKVTGQAAEAAKFEREDRAIRQTFLKGIVAEAVVVVGMLLVGLGALVYWFVRWMRTPTPPIKPRRAPMLKPWKAMDALEIWVLVLLAIVAGQGLALALRGEDLGALGMFGVHAFQYALTAALPLWVIWRKTRDQPRGMAKLVGLAPIRIGGLAGGIFAYAVFLAVALLVAVVAMWLMPMFGANVQLSMLAQTGVTSQLKQPLAAALFGVLAIFVAPVVEETIFRGFIYAGLRRAMPVSLSVVLSAVMFAAAHAHVGVSETALGGIAVLAIALAYAYERTRNLWVCMGMHMIHNALVFALLALAAL